MCVGSAGSDLNIYFGRSETHLLTAKHLFFKTCYQVYLLCSKFSVLAFLRLISSSCPYTHKDIYTFSNQRVKFFVTTPILLKWSKLFFSTLSSRSFPFFILHCSYSSNAMYLLQIFTNSISFSHLSHFNSLALHKFTYLIILIYLLKIT